MAENIITTLPHSEFGDPDCCGCLDGRVDGDVGHITCNECGAVVRSVPVGDLQTALHEMELTLDVATGFCPHCRNVNLFPGFSVMRSFVCQRCGSAVDVAGLPKPEQSQNQF